MQTVSTGYRQASEQAEQQPVARLLVDWGRTGNYVEVPVSDITVRREITSDLPSEVTLISGVAAATADAGLVGDPVDPDRHAGLLYSPYRADSPVYGLNIEGAPARVEMGLQVAGSPERLTQLTGTIRDLTLDVDVGGVAVAVQLVDGREDFRSTPTLPVVVGNDTADLSFPRKPGLDVHWIADLLARQAGYYASPPTRADCLVSATLHGSAWPEVGDFATGSYWDLSSVSLAFPVRFAPGRTGALATETQDIDVFSGLPHNEMYWLFADGQVIGQANGDTMFCEAWYYIGPSTNAELGGMYQTDGAGFFGARRIVLRTDGAGHVGLVWSRGGSSATSYPTTARLSTLGWHYVGWHITYGATNTTIRIRVDGFEDTLVVSTPSTYTGPGLAAAGVFNYGAEAFQVTTEAYSTGMWNDAFAPTAVLEPGLSELTVVPAIGSADDIWTILQAIARATAGVVFLDEQRVLQVWNRRHFGTATRSTTIQRTLRASTPVTQISVRMLADRIRNIIQVGVTPYRVTDAAIVWALTDVVSVPPRGSWSQRIDLSPTQAYQISTDTHVYPGGGPTVDGRSGYRAARHQDGTGGAVTNLAMTVVPGANSVQITITNPNTYAAWLVSPSGAGYPTTSNGQPSVALIGRLITTAGTEPDSGTTPGAAAVTVEYRDDYSISIHGEKPLSLDASPWMQNIDDALTLAQELGFEISESRPQWPPFTIIADPALQLGDRVWMIDDSGITGINDPAWIVGITTNSSSSGATQALALRPVTGPGVLILDDPVRGLLDEGWVLG